MRSTIRAFVLLIIIVIVGGCQMGNGKIANSEEFPDVRAFQDEFTRGFLQSTEETRPGYYSFLSGTGAYQMDFPEDGIIGERGYVLKEDEFEGFIIGIGNEESIIKSTINIKYNSYKKSGYEQRYMKSLEQRVGSPLNYEIIKGEKQTLHIAPFEYENYKYGYAAYLQKEDHGVLEVIHKTTCDSSNVECEKFTLQKIEEVYDWMMSLKFILYPEATR